MILKHFFTAAAALFAIPALCHAYFTQGDAGQEVFSFINTFDSPRNASLEKSAGAGISTDPTITQLNPAAVTMPEGKRHVAAAHWQTGDMAENQGSLFYTAQLGKFIFQTSYNWLSYGSIEGYDEYGESTGKDYEPFSQLATVTATIPLKHFRFGTTLKFASDKLTDDSGDRTALGAAFDWGIAWQAESKRFGFSLMGRDFGCLLRDYTDDGDDEYYPMSQTFAIAGFFRPNLLPRLTVFANTDFPRYQESFLSLGGEYAIGSSLFARVGFQRTWLDITRDVKELLASKDRPDETNNAHMLSAGLGYAMDLFALDYSFSYLAEGMGHEHRLGLRINF
ncbi:hypothetical protein [Fibrobacter sp.]|uniref:hypothetical protein n=1 Tax=Fibrobacter sp. TaxID=35828 RepID=UPI00388EB63F